jgi:hypothetical protein
MVLPKGIDRCDAIMRYFLYCLLAIGIFLTPSIINPKL